MLYYGRPGLAMYKVVVEIYFRTKSYSSKTALILAHIVHIGREISFQPMKHFHF